MAFVTLVFGNGLGRAVDNDFFALEKGIEKVWSQKGILKIKDGVKESLLSCLPTVGGAKPKIPTSEDQLLKLHEVNNSCRKLREIEPGDPKWLTDSFREFPESIDEFIAKVSFHFHCHKGLDFHDGYKNFLRGVGDFINACPTHLATLNYDNLLYHPLIERGILSGYNGKLIDGFHKTGFRSANLARTEENQKKMGWYLHLHGSPLFYDDENGRVKKYAKYELEPSFRQKPLKHRHVVLRHSKDKTEVINESKLLKTYWRFLSKALRQSTHVYLIGYGGYDDHLNREIAIWAEQRQDSAKDFTVKVLERKTSVDINKRKDFWADKLSTDEFDFPIKNIRIKRHDNILDFDWNQEIKTAKS